MSAAIAELALGLALSASLPALPASPIQVEHERSREARERIAAGQPDRALESYGALEKEIGPRPEITIGRGAALLTGKRAADAATEFAKARSAAEPLGSQALLGLSDALAGAGDLDGAIDASRQALRRDPALDDARHNLEVLLRRKQEAQGPPRPSPGGPPRPGEDGKGAGPGAGEPSGGGKPGERPGPGRDPPAEKPAAGRPGGESREGREAGAERGGKLSGDEARRLLDAMRSREPNLPPRAARARPRRGDVEKDW